MTNNIEPKKPMCSEDFYFIDHVNDPRIHPNGVLIAYSHSKPQREGKSYLNAIWVTHREHGEPRQYTAGGKGGDHSPRWSPDGKTLAFVSNRSGKPQVFILPVDGGEAKALTSMQNGAVNPVWSPDSQSIAFMSETLPEERDQEDQPAPQDAFIDEITARRQEEDRKHAEEMRYDPRIFTRPVFRNGTVFKDGRTTHIYVQKVNESTARRITNGDFDFGPFCWTTDGKYIITSSKQVGDIDIIVRTDLWTFPVDGGEPNCLTEDENGNFDPHVSPDNQWIYYMSFQAAETYKQRMKLKRIALTGGQPEDLMSDYDFDPFMFQLSPDGEFLYFGVCKSGREIICRVPAAGGVPETILEKDGMAGPFHLDQNGIVYRFEAPDIPSDIFYHDLNTREDHRLTRINESFLASRSLSIPKEIWYDGYNRQQIQGWYMLPHGYEDGKKYPWVVQIHGGPHIMWGYSWWHEFQSMCARGYGVFFCNPRGSDGYGSTFKGSIHLKWGDEDSQDILNGCSQMVEMGLADPEKLYLTGGSFGGFMTAWIVGHDHRFKAAVAQRGVYNFISMYAASDALTLIEWEFDTLPWEKPEFLWDRSPIKYVTNVQTPLMIIHSEQDFRVGISQADELFVALRRLGKEAKFVRFPREGHELSRSGEPKHRVARINHIIGWFNEHP